MDSFVCLALSPVWSAVSGATSVHRAALIKTNTSFGGADAGRDNELRRRGDLHLIAYSSGPRERPQVAGWQPIV